MLVWMTFQVQLFFHFQDAQCYFNHRVRVQGHGINVVFNQEFRDSG